MSPSASRNANRKRRIRRNITLLRRAGYAEAVAKQKALIHLMAVLAQSGGEVTVTKGTIDQIMADLSKMSYSVDKGTVENELVFRLVVAEDTLPVVEVSPIEDTATTEPLLSNPDVLGGHIGEVGE